MNTTADTARRIDRIVALATQTDQRPNDLGITARDLAGNLLDRMDETDRYLAVRALYAVRVSL